MKKLKIFIVLSLLFSVSSCKKYLEVAPDFGLDESDVFSDYVGVRGYLDQCYRALQDIHEWENQGQIFARTSINGISDEMGTMFNSGLNQNFNTGDWLDKPAMGEVGWDSATADKGKPTGVVINNAFISIRIANKVIEKINDVPGLTADQKMNY